MRNPAIPQHLPESCYIMAATPGSCLIMDAPPEPSAIMAATSESMKSISRRLGLVSDVVVPPMMSDHRTCHQQGGLSTAKSSSPNSFGLSGSNSGGPEFGCLRNPFTVGCASCDGHCHFVFGPHTVIQQLPRWWQ